MPICTPHSEHALSGRLYLHERRKRSWSCVQPLGIRAELLQVAPRDGPEQQVEEGSGLGDLGPRNIRHPTAHIPQMQNASSNATTSKCKYKSVSKSFCRCRYQTVNYQLHTYTYIHIHANI